LDVGTFRRFDFVAQRPLRSSGANELIRKSLLRPERWNKRLEKRASKKRQRQPVSENVFLLSVNLTVASAEDLLRFALALSD
jgi:hypothetical protein